MFELCERTYDKLTNKILRVCLREIVENRQCCVRFVFVEFLSAEINLRVLYGAKEKDDKETRAQPRKRIDFPLPLVAKQNKAL